MCECFKSGKLLQQDKRFISNSSEKRRKLNLVRISILFVDDFENSYKLVVATYIVLALYVYSIHIYLRGNQRALAKQNRKNCFSQHKN